MQRALDLADIFEPEHIFVGLNVRIQQLVPLLHFCLLALLLVAIECSLLYELLHDGALSADFGHGAAVDDESLIYHQVLKILFEIPYLQVGMPAFFLLQILLDKLLEFSQLIFLDFSLCQSLETQSTEFEVHFVLGVVGKRLL